MPELAVSLSPTSCQTYRRHRTRGWGACVWIGSGLITVASERPTDTPTGADLPAGDVAAFEAVIGVHFDDPALLHAALTHPSFANEHPEDPAPTNERLEFLGDAILGAIVAEELYARFPQVQEGRLTEWRSALVCGPTLSRVAVDVLDLGPWLRLGRGEEQTGGREREGNLERAYEAIVGAVYLDRGLATAGEFVRRTLGDEFEALARDPGVLNPKGTLQQIAQEHLGRPEYRLVGQSGPEHDREFTVEVYLQGEALGRGQAGTKQEAEKNAARQALPKVRARLRELGDAPAGIEQPGAGEHGTAGGTAVPGSGS
ncbi:MAG: ribonuclease III [Dehalococcoidia bacterium]|nr:ribonuclease III [Dehalococcoidia bacterium]MCA9850160.1 ribonuclease III [Dehalococcoidia bacterium]MCA9855772.1 ribonuclease III [Dehalococcoidia bacterium]MCB9484080.1 ribonuclease III [Dehalococcoidia bacterium]MCB9490539.1 ribonuclease III [Dehalococcoidia bacterium]